MAALYKEQLGQLIRKRRDRLGLTQSELADRAGIKAGGQGVSRWERGINAPEDLEAVARALETTVGELLGGLRPVNVRRRSGAVDPAEDRLRRIEAKLDALLELAGAASEPAGGEAVPPLELEPALLPDEPAESPASPARARRRTTRAAPRRRTA